MKLPRRGGCFNFGEGQLIKTVYGCEHLPLSSEERRWVSLQALEIMDQFELGRDGRTIFDLS
jgi:hypothetical protein